MAVRSRVSVKFGVCLISDTLNGNSISYNYLISSLKVKVDNPVIPAIYLHFKYVRRNLKLLLS